MQKPPSRPPSKPSAAPAVLPAAAGAVLLQPSDGVVLTAPLGQVVRRAHSYLRAGYPVHFSGPAGIGKTTLALHVAAQWGRPVVLIQGDHELGSSDLTGSENGIRRVQKVDNYVRSVLKTEESISALWTDQHLTLACRHGYTLVYDEFTRSRPEANNAMLSVLEERLLTLPRRRSHGADFLEVHPDFRALFTSNPDEYAGVHRSQDALLDRLVTIRLDYLDTETEVEITESKGGVCREDAAAVVRLVQAVRRAGLGDPRPSLRACIMIARMLQQEGASAQPEDGTYWDICQDVLGSPALRGHKGDPALILGRLRNLLRETARKPETPAKGWIQELGGTLPA